MYRTLYFTATLGKIPTLSLSVEKGAAFILIQVHNRQERRTVTYCLAISIFWRQSCRKKEETSTVSSLSIIFFLFFLISDSLQIFPSLLNKEITALKNQKERLEKKNNQWHFSALYRLEPL
jgi:hypothetical protein